MQRLFKNIVKYNLSEIIFVIVEVYKLLCVVIHYENTPMQYEFRDFFQLSNLKMSLIKKKLHFLCVQKVIRRGGSNEYPQSMFWSKYKKKCLPL